MEVRIQDLVTSIREKGVVAANEQAEEIIAAAKAKADAIVSEATAEAKNVKAAAEREIGILKEGAIVSADQAKRDAVLAFKTEIKAEFERILSVKVKENLNGAALGTLIKAVVQGEEVGQYAAEVAEVSDELKNALSEEIKGGLEIRPTKGVSAGFRLAAKDGSGYFDCSDEEIMQMLMPYFRDLDL